MKLDMIAFEAEMKRLRGAYIMDIAPACEMYSAALARVAELESQLAAQQWRPVTEDWPPYNISVPVRLRDGSIRWGYRHGDRWNLTGGKYGIEAVTHAYELPPAPQETE